MGLETSATAGLAITEVDEEGSVSALKVSNPLDRPVLLFEGEMVTGLKQNRMISRPLLVPARIEAMTVPVSCVERGRWEWTDQQLSPSSHASHPSLRAAAHRGGQGAVWDEVDATMSRHEVRSSTRASEDLYAHESGRLGEYVHSLPLQDGQCGSLVLIDGEAVCVDWVSRLEVHETLYPKLLRGYALEALGTAPKRHRVDGEEFITLIDDAYRNPLPPVGAGEGTRLASTFLVGHELRLDGEVVAVTALAL